MRTHRVRAASTLALAALALSGCASAGLAWRAGPAGIHAERTIRRQLTAGDYATVLASLKSKEIAPADKLLQHLYKGVAALHAGEWELGTRAMDRAWEISDQRWTKHVRDAAAAMATGEGALPYTPGPAERMFIPYFGALNWLARNERDDAAVEARRLSVLLASENGAMPSAEFRGGMRYVAGVLFESVGEWNDAGVAYRNADALLEGELPGDTVPPDLGHGDVVVLMEEGFVARPEPRALEFWLDNDEMDVLKGDDEGARVAMYHRLDGRRGDGRDWSSTHYRRVAIQWPAMSLEMNTRGRGALGARVWRGDAYETAPTLTVDVSAAVRVDFEREQPGRLARAIARAAMREAALNGAGAAFEAAGDASKKPKRKVGAEDDDDDKKNRGWKVAGLIVAGLGLLALHSSSAILDQPDLRAWQLLPDRVAIARLRLPVGDHQVEVTRDGIAYSLGTVTVRGGAVTVLQHRWWPDGPRVLAADTPR